MPKVFLGAEPLNYEANKAKLINSTSHKFSPKFQYYYRKCKLDFIQ